jgi:serine/threonine protein kinase/Tol biopolymer transport system component
VAFQRMTTSVPDRLKPSFGNRYTIERELGSGAMATVYLAHDLKHHRDVAVKVLRPELSALLGAERFLNEIDVVAHLQHPHILPLFDSGAADELLYYVTPRIEGESLRERMRRERQLPIGEALEIAKQVAGALDYAHRHNVIHRDVKPGNILLQDGQALVADFGIALAVNAAGGDRITETGLSLGTPGYMSPEQATGERELDARSDIYSLGAVLYEMLAGDPPHTGSTTQAVLAKTVTQPPRPVRQLRETVPSHVEAALSKALAKVPADRFRSAAEFSRALAESTTERSFDLPQGDTLRPLRLRRTGWLFVAIAGWITAALAAAFIWSASQRSGTRDSVRPLRSEIVLPDSAPIAFVGVASLGIGRPALALAADASRLVYVGRRGKTTQLYHRQLDELTVTPLPGTDGAYNPFFSPDGRWVAFFAGTELKKVSIPGGQVVTLAQVEEPMGGFWSPDGRILVAAGQGHRPAWLSAAGGALQPIGTLPEVIWGFPQLLPGGDWILHTSQDRGLYLTSLKLGRTLAITSEGIAPRESTHVSKLLFGKNPRYVNSGHIVYLSGGDGVLMALPFDAGSRRVLGPPAPVLEGIRQEAEAGAGQFAIADDGTFVYAPGANGELSVLLWVDRQGRLDTLPLPRAAYGPFHLSPDGTQILIRIVSASGRAELWVLDLDRGSRTRVATQGVPFFYPRWSADGKHVIFTEFAPAGGMLSPVVRQRLTDASRRDTLVATAIVSMPSPDGNRIAVKGWRGDPGLWLLPIDGRGGKPELLVRESVNFPSFSPDGRWLAYLDGGQAEIYAINADDPQERHKISLAGGEEALWSPRGDQIIYRNGQQWLAVDVSTQNGFRAGRPRVIFEGPYLNVPGWSHDISSDGQRHLVLLGPQEQTGDRLIVVTNWFAELKRIAPPSRR